MVVRLDSRHLPLLGETQPTCARSLTTCRRVPWLRSSDEFDALSKDRGASDDHGELKRSVNAVLQMMDGYRGPSILIATTNYETLLDKAVWRRFDEVIRFRAPELGAGQAPASPEDRRAPEPRPTTRRRRALQDCPGTSSASFAAPSNMVLSNREFLAKAT